MKAIQRKDLLDCGYRIPAINVATKEVEYVIINNPTDTIITDCEDIIRLVYNNVVYDIDSIDLDFFN